jgi:hypothetical protein
MLRIIEIWENYQKLLWKFTESFISEPKFENYNIVS